MYEKKLRQFFKKNKSLAEEALDKGDNEAAASYYERCGDILKEQAQNKRGRARKEKQKLADKYYELSDNLAGRSSSLEEKYPSVKEDGGGSSKEEEDFSDYVERFIQESNISWDDVAGLEETKRSIKESFALSAISNKPAAIESLHTILLYGPPGTGKTLLASAMAGSHDYPFFNVKLSHALSKYYGESGKIISEIFNAARERSPSIVFFDELDSIAMSRGGDMDEATRRVLSTLLTELSGFDKENQEIMFVGATNAPWDMDPAVLSRVERVVYVPLPDTTTVRKIIELNTEEQDIRVGCDINKIAERCVRENFSGREVKNLAKEAVRNMVNEMNPDLEELADKSLDHLKSYQLKLRAVQEKDFDHAFKKIDPKTSEALLERYDQWGDEFGK